MKMQGNGIHELFINSGKTIATAESCTGGNVAHQITRVSGSSEYYVGGVIAYANSVKVNVLGVSESDIEKYGVVSEVVAKQMALGIRKVTGADFAVSTTGVAGPTGGSEETPVGTVWIGVSSVDQTFAECFLFEGDREQVIEQATEEVLGMVTGLCGPSTLRQKLRAGSSG